MKRREVKKALKRASEAAVKFFYSKEVKHDKQANFHYRRWRGFVGRIAQSSTDKGI